MGPCMPIWTSFIEEVNARHLSVLEIGSRQSVFGTPSVRESFPNAKRYIGIDYHAGTNVDVVGDVHRLHSIIGNQQFDAIHSAAVIEHLAMPWVAAVEMIKVLSLGGIMFHLIPFSWPLHELPWDFWRFTSESFRVLFPQAMGMQIEALGADDPLFLQMETPPPGQEDFNKHRCYGFFGAKLRKVNSIDLSRFQWPIGLPELLGHDGGYPLHNS